MDNLDQFRPVGVPFKMRFEMDGVECVDGNIGLKNCRFVSSGKGYRRSHALTSAETEKDFSVRRRKLRDTVLPIVGADQPSDHAAGKADRYAYPIAPGEPQYAHGGAGGK